MTNKVVKVSVEAMVEGYVLGVSDATLTLGVNSIPTIELTCAPTESSLVPLSPNVSSPRISDYAELYDSLAELAQGRGTPGYVHINIQEDGKQEEALLNGWILSGAGLSTIQSTSAPHLSVTFQHPICNLTKVGSIYQTPRSDMATALNKAINARSTDFIKVLESVYRCVRGGVRYWPSPVEARGWPEKLRESLGVGEFSPSKYLDFKGDNGIFLGKGGSVLAEKEAEFRVRIAQAIGRAVLPSSGGSSTWDAIMSAAGSLLLSVTQDEERNFMKDKLVLEPVQPWKEKTITLDEERCQGTEIPGQDPFRIIGVMATKLGPYTDITNLGLMANGQANDEDPVGEIVYVPFPKGANVSAFDGRIMKTNAPSILDSAFRRDAPYGKDIPSGLAKGDEVRKNNYNRLLLKYCRAVYETASCSMMRARAKMVLGLKDVNGKLILPGNTCSFVSGGKDMYYGYANKVIHHVSTYGDCATVVDMSHVRPEADLKINGYTAIKSGSKNAAYE